MLRFLIVVVVIAATTFLGFTWAAEGLTGQTLPQVNNFGVYAFFGMIGFAVAAVMAD